MDKIQAKEKINKLLRLANDKGATPSERDTALEMASKLASKFDMKVQKGTPVTSNQNRPEKIRYEFDLNCFNKKFVKFFFDLFGITDYFFYGKKEIVFYGYRNFDVDAFKKFYKKFVSVYYKTKKEINFTEKKFFEMFILCFLKGINGHIEAVTTHTDMAAYKLGEEFKNIKFF